MIAIVEIVSLIVLAISLKIDLFSSSLLETFPAAFFFKAAGKGKKAASILVDENGANFLSNGKNEGRRVNE